MARSGRSLLLGLREDTCDPLLHFWQLLAHFDGPYVEHHRFFSDPPRGIRKQHEVKRWARVRKLGQGAWGKVYLQSERDGALRAVKRLKKDVYKDKAMDYLREILAMAEVSKVTHRWLKAITVRFGSQLQDTAYFIELIGWYLDEHAIYIAMEYAPHGDLNNCVKAPLPESEARIITQQIVDALEILHGRRWAHRDLKPSNILVIQREPQWWVKLGDFGVSKSVANDMTRLRTTIDTDFTAPEIIGFPGAGPAETSIYTYAADLWSLGFLIRWILTLKLPLTRPETGAFWIGALTQLSRQHLQEQSISEEVIHVVRSLLHPLPSQKSTAHDLREHKWLQDDIALSAPAVKVKASSDPHALQEPVSVRTSEEGITSKQEAVAQKVAEDTTNSQSDQDIDDTIRGYLIEIDLN